MLYSHRNQQPQFGMTSERGKTTLAVVDDGPQSAEMYETLDIIASRVLGYSQTSWSRTHETWSLTASKILAVMATMTPML